MAQKFKAKLQARGPGGAWIFMIVPFSVEKVFNSRARVPVTGTINGFPYRTSILPEGDGTHYLAVNKAMQAGANAAAGDTVSVTMEVDKSERVVELPPELIQLLKKDAKANAFFESLSYTSRKEFAVWIAGAKRPETKTARLQKTAEMLAAGKKLAL